jgi:hypothetical protein
MLCLITYRRLAQGILLLHRYLLLYHPSVLPSLHEFFSLMSITESIPKLYSIAQCTKFPFQRVIICPNRTLDKRVTSVLLDEIYPKISERAMLNVFSITPCTGLQIRWFVMRWNGNFKDILNILFSSFVHL